MNQRSLYWTGLNIALVACAVAFWIALNEGTFSLSALTSAVLWIGALVLCGGTTGALLVRWCGLRADFQLLLLNGFIFTGAVLLGLVWLVPISTMQAFLMIIALCLLSILAAAHRGAAVSNWFQCSAWSMLLTGFALIAATLWSLDSLRPFAGADGGVIFKPWKDLFLHSIFVFTFRGEENPFIRGNPEYLGLPLTFYHYASFTVSAVYADLSQIDSLTAAGALLVPCGFVLLAFAGYVLWSTIFSNNWAGWCAAVFVIALPDASRYWPHNRWFSYYWTHAVGSSICFGIAAAALALCLLLGTTSQLRLPQLLLGAFYSACVLLFKAQIFVPFALLAGGIIAVRFIKSDSMSRKTKISVAAFLFCAAVPAGIYLASVSDLGPNLRSGSAILPDYLPFLGRQMDDQAYGIELTQKVAAWPAALMFVSGLTLIAVSSFGFLLLIYLAGLIFKLRRKQRNLADFAPLAGLAIYLALIIALPKNDFADPWVMVHRGFVWVYFLLAGWCGAQLASRLAWQPLVAGALLLLAVPWRLGPGVHLSGPAWGKGFAGNFVSSGIIAASKYIKRHSNSESIVQISTSTNDFFLMALADRPGYFFRPGIAKFLRANPQETEQRAQEMQRLKEATTAEEVRRIAGKLPIDWYLASPHDPPKWMDLPGIEAVLAEQGYALYDFAALRRKARAVPD